MASASQNTCGETAADSAVAPKAVAPKAAATIAAAPKAAAPMDAAPKAAAPMDAAPQAAAPMAAASKAAAPIAAALKAAAPMGAAPKFAAPMAAAPKAAAPMGAVPKVAALIAAASKAAAPMGAVPKVAALIAAAPKVAAPIAAAPKVAAPMGAIPKVAAPIAAAPKVAAPMGAIPKVATPMGAIPKVTATMGAIPKVAAPMGAIPKVAAPMAAAPKVAAPMAAAPMAAAPMAAATKFAFPKAAFPKAAFPKATATRAAFPKAAATKAAFPKAAAAKGVAPMGDAAKGAASMGDAAKGVAPMADAPIAEATKFVAPMADATKAVATKAVATKAVATKAVATKAVATKAVAPKAVAFAGPLCGQKPNSPQNVPPALAEKPVGLPFGKYKLVGLDIETTGRRLVDEIIQIAAFTPPGKTFSQYIMPHGDLNLGARRRFHVRVATMGRYRMLKYVEKSKKHPKGRKAEPKVIKTKSEIAALIDFLNWLESIKPKDELILLLYHEPRRLYPTVLIQSLIRYNLFDRFTTLVAGFTDSYALCAEVCKGTFKSVSLLVLTQLLLDDETYKKDTASTRAKAIYNIIEQLANQAGDYLDLGAGDEAAAFTGPSEEMMELACEFARPVSTELMAYEALKDLLEKQNTFRLAFTPLLRSPRHIRHRLTQLRRSLTDAGLLYEQVKDAWHEGRRAGLVNLFIPLEQTLSPEDIQHLVDIFDTHFAPVPIPSVVSESSFGLTYDSDEPNQGSDSDTSGQLSPSTGGRNSLLRALCPRY